MNIEGILNSLRRVAEPDLKKDLVTLNMIENVEINESKVRFDLVLTTPACPFKDVMKNDCEQEIRKDFPNVTEIKINMISRVTTRRSGIANDLLPGVKNTVAVASGKGGVGKSTVAVNIASALAKQGAKVGLIDADIYGPSIPLMLGINEKPKFIPSGLNSKMLPVENYGIKVMSIGFLIEENVPVIWRGPMAGGAIKQFMSDVEWGELDYLFFDMPPGTGDIQLTLCQSIPLTGALIVTTPQSVSLADAQKALKMFERVNVPILGVVENMSYFLAPDSNVKYNIFGEGGGEKLAKENNTVLLGSLPIDERVRRGGDNGKPIIFEVPDSENSKSIMEISKKLAAEISKRNSLEADIPVIELN